MTYRLSGAPVTFVNVTDRERALAFYQGTLGLALKSSDPFGDFIALDGGLLRMTVMPGHVAQGHPVLGWDVEDIVASVEALRDRGVVFTIYEGFGQDDLGIWTAPDGETRLAFFADPDGNVLTLSRG